MKKILTSVIILLSLSSCVKKVTKVVQEGRQDEVKRFEDNVKLRLKKIKLDYQQELEALKNNKDSKQIRDLIRSIIKKEKLKDKDLNKPYMRYKNRLYKTIERLIKWKYNVFMQDKDLTDDIQNTLDSFIRLKKEFILMPELGFEYRF